MKELRRALALGPLAARAGYQIPLWYSVIRAARYLRVPPWLLLDQNIAWVMFALAAERAEAEAADARQDRGAIRIHRRPG